MADLVLTVLKPSGFFLLMLTLLLISDMFWNNYVLAVFIDCSYAVGLAQRDSLPNLLKMTFIEGFYCLLGLIISSLHSVLGTKDFFDVDCSLMPPAGCSVKSASQLSLDSLCIYYNIMNTASTRNVN